MKRLSVRFLPSPTYAALTNRQREQRRLWHFFCLELCHIGRALEWGGGQDGRVGQDW